MTVYPTRRLERISGPAIEPLTLAETKLYLRVDGIEEDALITSLIAAARVCAEEYLNRSLIQQQWKLAYNDETPACVPLPRGPVSAVNSVVTTGRSGGTQTIAASTYFLNAAKDALEFDSTPLAFLIEISYTAGYGADATYVPEPIKKGLLAHIASLYDNRGQSDAPFPAQSISLYAPFREVRV